MQQSEDADEEQCIVIIMTGHYVQGDRECSWLELCGHCLLL